MSNAPSKPVSFSRPKVGYFSNRPRISDNEIYLLIKYIKSVLWRVAKRLSYIEDARCLKVNSAVNEQRCLLLSVP